MGKQHYLDQLTKNQRAAVEHHEGPALVLACPGSGKTRVITYRIVHLLHGHGASPAEIMAVTFTNKAANEMKERVQKLLPGKEAERLHISTFHSMCARILRKQHRAAGLSANYTICDDSDSKAYVVQSVALETEEDPKKVKGWKDEKAPDKVQRFISNKKQNLLTAEDVLDRMDGTERDIDRFYARCYSRYQAALRKTNSVDFDDLIMKTVLLMRDNEAVREQYASAIKFLLIDEYQDTNPSQYELAGHLSSVHGNIFVVGDTDQCLVPTTTVMGSSQAAYDITKVKKGNVITCAAGRGSTASAVVEAVHERRYTGNVTKLTTKGGKELTGTPGHCIFMRPSIDSNFYYTYLMWDQTKGYRIGRTSPVRSDGDSKRCPGFVQRLRQERADAIWIIKASKEEADAAYWEAYFAAKYGLPTCCFHASGRRLAMDTDRINKLFSSLNTEEAAKSLLVDQGLSLRHPHYTPQATTTKNGKTRNSITMTMFGSTRPQTNNVGQGGKTNLKDPWYQHELSICSSAQNTDFREQVSRIIPTRGHKKKYWSARKSLGSYDDILQLSIELEKGTDGTARRRARMTEETYNYTPLAHAVPGMLVPVLDAETGTIIGEEIERVENFHYDGPVYDLTVPDFRNFIAEGIVVHNSIYAFRGAQPENLDRMETDYDGTEVFFLEDNFRSTQAIADVANELIAQNTNRKPKQIKPVIQDGSPVRCIETLDTKQEAAIVVDEILSQVRAGQAEFKDYAILYRMHTRSRVFEELLVAHNVPHRIIGGLGFYNRAVIKDVIAYLKLVQNSADEASFLRIYNKPSRGFGDTSYAKLHNLKEERGGTIITTFRKRWYEDVLKGRSKAGAENIRDVFHQLYQLPKDRVGPLVEGVIEYTGYDKMLRANNDDKSREQLEHLNELTKAAQDFDEAHGNGLLRFLEWTSLMQNLDEDDDENRVHLMTCHAAKGLEFPRLYVVGAIDGVMPIVRDADDYGRPKSPEVMEKDIQEERRIFFVALTRAERHLTITHSQQQFRYGSVEDCYPSRFLSELGETVEHEIVAGTSAGSYLLGALNTRRNKKKGYKKRPHARRRKF